MRSVWKFLLAEVIGILISVGIVTAYGVFTRPTFPNDAPTELKILSTEWYTEGARLIAYNSSGATIGYAHFGNGVIMSVAGHWYGENATLEIKGNESGKVEATPTSDYLSSLSFWRHVAKISSSLMPNILPIALEDDISMPGVFHGLNPSRTACRISSIRQLWSGCPSSCPSIVLPHKSQIIFFSLFVRGLLFSLP